MLNIVTSDLQLYLVASNIRSAWTDLTINDYSTTLFGSTAFNTADFTFDGTISSPPKKQKHTQNIATI